MTPSDPPTFPARDLGRSVLLGVLVLGLAGCVKNFANPFDRSTAAASEIQVEVDNQNFNDVRLYKLGPEGRENVGSVTGRSTRTIQVSWRQTADLRFQIEVLAGRDYRTNVVTASPGDRFHLIIRENSANTILIRR